MTGRGGETLRAILESATVPKVFNAISFSSLPLYARFGIFLQGVQDMQILQWASRPGPLIYPIVNQRLGAALKRDARITPQERSNAKTCYEAAAKLYDSSNGGSLQVFGNRPLAEYFWAYWVHTLKYLPHLHNIYWNRVVELRREQLVANLTQKRLQFCRDPNELSFVRRPPVSLISSQGSQIGPMSKIHFCPQRPIHRKVQFGTLRKVLRPWSGSGSLWETRVRCIGEKHDYVLGGTAQLMKIGNFHIEAFLTFWIASVNGFLVFQERSCSPKLHSRGFWRISPREKRFAIWRTKRKFLAGFRK